MTFDIKGFPKENINVKLNGRTVTLDAHFRQENRIGPSDIQKSTETTAYELAERRIHQTGTIPEGVDLKTVKIDVDSNPGVVIITGNAKAMGPSSG